MIPTLWVVVKVTEYWDDAMSGEAVLDATEITALSSHWDQNEAFWAAESSDFDTQVIAVNLPS
jgi:hypothetical protein